MMIIMKMRKKANSSIILLLVSLASLVFVSFISYFGNNSNEYETSQKNGYYPYFLSPFSIINAYGSAAIENDNDESLAQGTGRSIGFSNVTNLTDNPNDSVYPQVAASENNVYLVWEDSTTSDLSNNNYDIYIKKSADWGESFAGNSNSIATGTATEVLNLSNNPGFSEHPQIAAYNEKVHVTWIDNSLGNKEVLFARSIDNGTIFSEAINLSNTTNTNSRNLEIAAFENNVYAVWLDEDEQGNGIILFKASNDGGETFSNAVAIARNISNNNDFTLPKVAAYGDNVYVAWNAVAYSSNAQEGEIMTDLLYVKSSDQGNTFSAPIKLNNNGEKVGEAQLAAYNNAVYVVWGSSPYDHITSNLFFMKSTDNGNTFSNATEVKNDNFVNPSNVEIVVVGNNNSEGYGEQSLLSSSPSSQQVQELQLYITGQVPLSDQNEEIFLASSSDNGDTFNQITTNLSNNSEFSECSSIAASANNIYVIWQDRTPGNNEALFTKAKI
jgi:hypothetical protein